MEALRRLAARLGADRLAALLLFAVFVAYGIAGSGIEAALESDIVGPGFFPEIIAMLGGGLALVLLLQSRPAEGARVFAFDPVSLAPVALLLGYVLLLEDLGFPIATLLFLTLGFRYLGCPGWARSVVYASIATVALVALFRYGLELTLPRGTFIKLI